jgi:hypothetical protein
MYAFVEDIYAFTQEDLDKLDWDCYPEHSSCPYCWCEPELLYLDPKCEDNNVWLHRTKN